MNKAVKDALWFLFSAMFGPGLFFLMLPLWTRLLSKEEFALIGILRTIEGIGIAFLVVGFAGATARYYHEAKCSKDYASFFSSALVGGAVIGFLFLTVFCGLVMVFPNLLSPLSSGFIITVCIAIYLVALPESLVFASWMTAKKAVACN